MEVKRDKYLLNEVQIKVNEDDLKGHYANQVLVFHTQEEFILDFANIYPPVGVLASRVILSPSQFKRAITAMSQNLKEYENRYGDIEEAEELKARIGFRTD